MRNSLFPILTLFLALFAIAAARPASAAVGFQRLSIPDPEGPPIEAGVWYPTDAEPAPQRLETFVQTVAMDAPLRAGRRPLVVISHGAGGSFASHVDTAFALAQAGFVAAALTHTGDNWRDQSRATAVWERPRQLKLLTDYMLGAWPGRAGVDAGRVGAFGFSSGGFTVLVAAGGTPDLGRFAEHCREHPGFYDCRLAGRDAASPEPARTWTHDARIRAVVSAAPALGFTFGPDGLAGVRQPVQLWRAAEDQVLPHPFYAEAVRLALPAPPELHLVRRAGHYDFLPPCPEALKQAAPVICASAPGFDRSAFHADFNREVVAFFERTLAGP